MKNEEIREVYKKPGFTGRMGFGKSPAVVVIDFSYGFTDPKEPFGGNYDNEVSACLAVLEAARAKNVPIVYTTVAYYHSEEAGVWLYKNAMLRHLMLGTRQVEIDKRLKPRENEAVIVKKYTSGFAGTHLASYLTALGVDTVLVAGVTTSGCVRATAVDALQYGFRPIVIRDAVGDRAEEPHQANLFDIDSKFGDVEDSSIVIEYLKKLDLN